MSPKEIKIGLPISLTDVQSVARAEFPDEEIEISEPYPGIFEVHDDYGQIIATVEQEQS